MQFPTYIAGIPCQCNVIYATPLIPMRVYGPGMEDADPPEGGDFEFEILDRKGYRAKWLEHKLTSKDVDRLYEEFCIMQKAEELGYY